MASSTQQRFSLLRRGALVLALVGSAGLGVPACVSSSGRGAATKQEAPKLPPVKQEALRSYDAALRAMKLRGPDAPAKAIDRFKAALELDSKLWEAWHNIGVLELERGNTSAAVEAFSSALKINPVHEASLLGKAEALRAGGSYDKAGKAYKSLIAQDPTERLYYARAAAILRADGNYDEALDTLREALRVKGASAEIYTELGLIYLAQGRDELAKLVLRKANELDEKNPGVYNAMAMIAMGEGDDQMAFAHFDRAADLDPKYTDARYNKATVLLEAGDYAGAKVEFQRIAKISAGDMQVQVALGVAERGLGNHKKARKIWSQVAEQSPSGSESHSDALYNVAILEMDFVMDDKKALAALDRYLQSASSSHGKRKEAERLRKELGE